MCCSRRQFQVQISNISSFCVIHSLHLLKQPKKQTAINEWSLAGSQPVSERAVPSSLKAGLVILQEVQLLHSAGPMKAEERYRSGSGGRMACGGSETKLLKRERRTGGVLRTSKGRWEGIWGKSTPTSLSLCLLLYSLLLQGFRVCSVVLLMRTVGAEHSGWRSEKQLTLGILCSHTQNTH